MTLLEFGCGMCSVGSYVSVLGSQLVELLRGGGSCWKPGLIGQTISAGEREGADTCMCWSSDASILGTVLWVKNSLEPRFATDLCVCVLKMTKTYKWNNVQKQKGGFSRIWDDLQVGGFLPDSRWDHLPGMLLQGSVLAASHIFLKSFFQHSFQAWVL